MASSTSAARASISPPPSKRRRTSGFTKPVDSSRPPPGRLTIYSWNVNGIGPFLQSQITSFFKPEPTADGSDDASANQSRLRDVLRRYAWPTVLSLQEVKISPDDAATQRAVEKAVLRAVDDDPTEPSYRAFFCLPTDKHNARGFGRKLYGVCSIIRSDFYDEFVERMREVDWDSEGRFLVCETRSVGSLAKLAIINVYAVNGTDAPYKSPETGHVVGKRHDRKRAVHKLLQAECQELEANGFQVILAGDLNIARMPLDGRPNLRTFPEEHCVNRADFEARFIRGPRSAGAVTDVAKDGAEISTEGLAMIDSFRHLHPRTAAFTYHPRSKPFGSSCDRVDMILISRGCETRLHEAGICETPVDRGPSDHVPVYCVLQT